MRHISGTSRHADTCQKHAGMTVLYFTLQGFPPESRGNDGLNQSDTDQLSSTAMPRSVNTTQLFQAFLCDLPDLLTIIL